MMLVSQNWSFVDFSYSFHVFGFFTGGVRSEFFMLLFIDLLDPKYGMFKEYKDSLAIWFADHSFEEDQMYILIGTLCGLAIYNFTIINLPFPLCLYKKLLHEPVDISDLRDLSPFWTTIKKTWSLCLGCISK